MINPLFRIETLIFIATLVIIPLSLSSCMEESVDIHAAGATFPAPIYARWQALFNRSYPEINIHYQAIGSGKGIQAISQNQVDFGASDALLKETEKKALRAPLLTIPTVIGPVVMAYNLPDLNGSLSLSGEIIAGIYLGEITHWDDAKIKRLNPDAQLKSLPIRVAHRRDSSGTTHIFTDYLSAVSPQWKKQVGTGKRVFWPTEDDWAGEGNDGVAHRILLVPGGIGYLELKYAQNAGLSYATLINADGKRVAPSVASVQSAEKNTASIPGSYIKPSIVNAAGENSYPIAGFTYILLYQDLREMSALKAHALIKYLKWILTEGQQEAPKLHYTPLPEKTRKQALKELEKILLPELPEVVGEKK